MATLQLAADNSTYVQIALTNPIDSSFINNATVTGEILDTSDAVVIAPFSIPYVAASDGIYRATLAPDAGIINGITYKIPIDSTNPDGLVGFWDPLVKAKSLSC